MTDDNSPSANGASAITADEVAVDYATRSGRLTVLRGISLRLDSGKLAVLRGASGCGKTTLLMTLGGLLRPQLGSICVLGTPLYGRASGDVLSMRASRLRYCFQQPLLTPYLSARQNITTNSARAGAAEQLIDRLALRRCIAQRPAKLSAGEQQRVAFARALVTQPDVLLADEPTSSLDHDSTQAVCELIRGACDAGAVAVVAAHDSAVVPFADEIYDLTEGRLQRA